jgi:uncharacterized protein
MILTAVALRELHRIHRQLSDLRERQERGPRQIKAREVNLARLEEDVARVRAETKQARVQADQRQLMLKSGEAKLVDLRAKLNAASSNKEYQALKDQIAADEMANSVHTDEILDALEKIDGFELQIREAQARLERAQQELAHVRAQVTGEAESIDRDIARLEAELRDSETALHPDIRAAYDRVVKSKGAEALSAVEGEVCGGCSQRITANMANSLLMDRVVFCGNCGTLLYLPEGRLPKN